MPEVDDLCHIISAMKHAPTLAQKLARGLFLVATFMNRCVEPLQHRAHPMWEDTGVVDEMRLFHEELSSVELATRVSRVAKGPRDQVLNLDCPIPPFEATNPPPAVRRLVSNFLWVSFLVLVLCSSFARVVATGCPSAAKASSPAREG